MGVGVVQPLGFGCGLELFKGLQALGGVRDVVHLGHVHHKLVPNPVGEFEVRGIVWLDQRVALGDSEVEQDALLLESGQNVFDFGLGDFHIGNHPAAFEDFAAVGRVEGGEGRVGHGVDFAGFVAVAVVQALDAPPAGV